MVNFEYVNAGWAPIEHFCWNFLQKIVKSLFANKPYHKSFAWVLNTPLISTNLLRSYMALKFLSKNWLHKNIFFCLFSVNSIINLHLNNKYVSKDTSPIIRSSHPEVLLEKGVLQICSKFTENTHAKVWFQITLRDGCSPVNSLHIFGTNFTKNNFGRLPFPLSRQWYW